MSSVVESDTIPQHIAIIMDGNGRWASEQGLPRSEGHRKGAENVRVILEHAKERGVKYVTLYAFSSENWKRPKEEVKVLMDLFRKYLKEDVAELQKKKVRVSFIGDRTRFPEDMQDRMNEVERETSEYHDFHVILALSYGARDDIITAIKRIALDVMDRKYMISAIDEKIINEALSTHDIPYPD